MANRFRGSKAIQSHDLFPLLKKLAENCDRIPRHDHPEVIYGEIEEMLRRDLEQYDARTVPSNGKEKHGDELTKVLLDEISAVLDNCRQLLELHKQCRKRQKEQTSRIQQEFASKASSMLQSLGSQFQQQLMHPDPEDEATMDRQGPVSNSSSTCSSRQENRPTKLKCSERDHSSRSNSSPDSPAAKRVCCATGRARKPGSGISNSGTFVKTETPDDSGNVTLSPGSETDKTNKATFRHPTAVTNYLKDWYEQHIEYPYPTVQQKDHLLERLLTMFNFDMMKTQLDNWFINQRRRVPNGPSHQKLPGHFGSSPTSSLEHGNSMPPSTHSQPCGVTPTSVQSPKLLGIAQHSPASAPAPLQFFHSPVALQGAPFVQPPNAAASHLRLLNTKPVTCAVAAAQPQFIIMTTATSDHPATVQMSPQQLSINPGAVTTCQPLVASPVTYATPFYSATVVAPLNQKQVHSPTLHSPTLHSPTLRSPMLYCTPLRNPPALRSPTMPAPPLHSPPPQRHHQAPHWPAQCSSMTTASGSRQVQHRRQSKTTSPSHKPSDHAVDSPSN